MQAQIERLLNLAEKFPANPILERAWMGAEDVHSACVAYLAMWVARGAEPTQDHEFGALHAKAVGMARAWVKELTNGKVSMKLGTFTMVSGGSGGLKIGAGDGPSTRVVTQGYGSEDGSGCFAAWIPSDEARRQAGQERAKNGSGEYKGARTIWPKERCQPFDQRFPAHW